MLANVMLANVNVEGQFKALLFSKVDASMEARAEGITVFAVGVGTEITTSELISLANKPSSTYVLYAENYTNIDHIRDSMEQKLCEGQNFEPRHQPKVAVPNLIWLMTSFIFFWN